MVSPLEFESHRTYLVRLAYRMLGTVVDAEDIVQESYLRWHSAGQPELKTPRAWFTRTCTRLCLDRLKSAQKEREQYPGEWLPEPIDDAGPLDRRELDDTLSMALLATIQKLRPEERAAFLLHDVFSYEFEDVAELLDLEASHCRQLASRARRHLAGDVTRFPAEESTLTRVSEAFFRALSSGDLGALRSVLSADVVLHSDGGGKVSAARHPIRGHEKVLRFFDRIFVSARTPAKLDRTQTWFNGGPGVLVLEEGVPVSAFQFQLVDGKIVGIYVQRNPDKLGMFRTLAGGPSMRGAGE